MTADQAEPGFTHPLPVSVEERELPDRSVNAALMDDLLHAVQLRRAFGDVQLCCLFAEQRVDLGIAAIDVGAALDGERLQPSRRVAERRAPKRSVLSCFMRIALA